MDKPINWLNNMGESISEELGLQFQLEAQNPDPSIEPPKHLGEFEDRLMKLLDCLYQGYFGIAYYLDFDERRTLEKNVSYKNLIDIAIKCATKGPSVVNVQFECYEFLKMALEKNFPFSPLAQSLLGLSLDLSDLTKPKQDVIAVQCASQVLWYLKKSNIPKIVTMKDKLLDRKEPFFDLLGLGRFNDPRTIEKWVSVVYPIPKSQRKRRSQPDGAYDNIIDIPDIFTNRGTSFPRLRFAIICTTQTMKALGYSLSEIVNSRPVALLAEPLKFYPQRYASDWIKEAFSSNGSIYPL
jgi:hypothetical protein